MCCKLCQQLSDQDGATRLNDAFRFFILQLRSAQAADSEKHNTSLVLSTCRASNQLMYHPTIFQEAITVASSAFPC